MHTKKMEKIWYCLFEEFLVRQMYWIFHGEEQKGNTKKLLLIPIISVILYQNFGSWIFYHLSSNP